MCGTWGQKGPAAGLLKLIAHEPFPGRGCKGIVYWGEKPLSFQP